MKRTQEVLHLETTKGNAAERNARRANLRNKEGDGVGPPSRRRNAPSFRMSCVLMTGNRGVSWHDGRLVPCKS